MSTNDELRELRAKAEATRDAWCASNDTLGPEWQAYENAISRLHAATYDALPALLDRIEALEGDLAETQRLLVATTECRHEDLQDLKRAEAENAELRRQRDGWMAHNRESIARAESAERERDALAAELARVREVLEQIHAHGYTTTNDYEMVRACLAAKPKGEL
jgi:chromosome segregation ATPase